MYVYIYRSHSYGGYYVTEEKQDYDDLFCEQCGDSDTWIGEGWAEDILNDEREKIHEAIQDYRYMQELLRPYMEE